MTSALIHLRQLNAYHETMSRMSDALDWDGLEKTWHAAESSFSALVKTPVASLSVSERTEARQLIEKLLSLQKHISGKTIPWMDQVRPLLDSFERYPLTSDTA
jgi:hypothetical protein